MIDNGRDLNEVFKGMKKQVAFEIVDGLPPTHCKCEGAFALMPFYHDDRGGELYCPKCEPNTLRTHRMRLKRWAKGAK